MKKWILFFLPILLFSASLKDVLQDIKKSELLRAKKYEMLAKRSLVEVQKGKSLFSIDASLQGLYLRTAPTMQIDLGLPGMPTKFQAASQNQYRGEISLSYPLFTGFALTHLIKKSKADWIRSKLQKRDMLRKLYLKAVMLYSRLYALQQYRRALVEGIKASEEALKKAKGFFDEGLIAKSDLDNIEAKKYELQAKEAKVEADIVYTRSMLGYLTHKDIQSATGLPNIEPVKSFDIEKRADIQALKEAILMDEHDVKLAKSSLYPKVFLKVGLRGYGSDLGFEGDGYRNGDKSYAAFELRYNLYHGGSDKAAIDAAKYKRMARSSYLQDYIRLAKSQLQSDRSVLKSLLAKKEWAKKRLIAAKSYYKLTVGRYDNQLASADELSRAIAEVAEAKAMVEEARAAVFNQRCKILLQISLEAFKQGLGL